MHKKELNEAGGISRGKKVGREGERERGRKKEREETGAAGKQVKSQRGEER